MKRNWQFFCDIFRGAASAYSTQEKQGSLKNLNREGVKFIKQDFSLCSCGVVTLCPKCVKGQFKERSKVRKKDSFFVCVYF